MQIDSSWRLGEAWKCEVYWASYDEDEEAEWRSGKEYKWRRPLEELTDSHMRLWSVRPDGFDISEDDEDEDDGDDDEDEDEDDDEGDEDQDMGDDGPGHGTGGHTGPITA